MSTASSTTSTGPGGMGGGSGGMGGGAGGAGGMGGAGGTSCSAPTECPGADTECSVRTCEGGVCGVSNQPIGMPTPTQTPGDCKQVQCDGLGGEKTVNDSGDVLDDMSACTKDTCNAGTPMNAFLPSGAPCAEGGGALCNGAGACVQCLKGADCMSLVCQANTCVPASCGDMVKNGDESDLDCGGSCGPCATGEACGAAGDCASGVCTGSMCQAPTCSDGVKNGAEGDIDCGAACPSKCGPNLGCKTNSDCVGGQCSGSICVPSCTDGALNNGETDVDCGGPSCSGCDTGEACQVGSDCISSVCEIRACQAPTCTDMAANGDETDVDCGGSCPDACIDGQGCKAGADCASGVCAGDVCASPSCGDMVTNGDETDVDCGGSCDGCPDGGACGAPGDCTSGVCTGGMCASPACTDMVKNGPETGTDCGGGCPSPCPDGEGCLTGADCVSSACGANICQAPSCSDSVKNGMEIGPDCGGPFPMCHLVINEVDYDQAGTDSAEYIEIYNGTGADVDLAGLQLRFVNGSNNTVYLTVDLSSGGLLLDGQYLVVATAAQVVPASAIKIPFLAATNNIQNGAPDGVALVDTTSMQVIDALSYAGSMTMANLGAPFGAVSLVEGSALSSLTVDDGLGPKSLNRIPNGLDHNNAATDWAASTTLTPGAANVP